MVIEAADKDLCEDDLVQMVNAGTSSGNGHNKTASRPLVERA